MEYSSAAAADDYGRFAKVLIGISRFVLVGYKRALVY